MSQNATMMTRISTTRLLCIEDGAPPQCPTNVVLERLCRKGLLVQRPARCRHILGKQPQGSPFGKTPKFLTRLALRPIPGLQHGSGVSRGPPCRSNNPQFANLALVIIEPAMDTPPVQYVTTSDGASLAYAITGKGPTLVHLPILWSHFSLQWRTGIRRLGFETLAERFQLVLYDGRGQGLSTRGLEGDLPLDSLDADLEAVVQLLKSSRFLLYTRSLHGLVAIRYAVRHPERVAGIVLWNYIDTSVAAFAESFRSMAEADWETHLASNVLSFHAATGFPASESPLVKQVLREAIGKEELLAITGALRSTTAESLLGELRVPVLVLASRESARHERAARWLAARIPNAQLQLFDGPAGGMIGEEGAVPPAVQAMEQFAAGLDYGRADSDEKAAIGDFGLSSREIEVLRLVGHGLSNQQIADELVISINTVRRHVSNIFDKTGVANRAQAVAYARDHGIA